MNATSKENIRVRRNEKGAVLVISMVLLVVITVIGVAAIQTSTFETLISNASKQKQEAFYAAEAGIEHAKVAMSNLIDANTNNPNAGVGTIAPWDFIFDDTTNYPPVDEAEFQSDDFERMAYLFQDQAFGDHAYTVTLGDTTAGTDTDGKIWVRSYGVGPSGARSIIEVSYQGTHVPDGSGATITDYGGQDKKGAVKGSAGNDTEAISQTDLGTTQMAQSY